MQETLQYQTPQHEPRARWRPSRLFLWTAGISAAINVILCICLVMSGPTYDFGLALLLTVANFPAIPVMYLLAGVLSAIVKMQPGAGWLLVLLFCCVGSTMWGLLAVLVRELLKFAARFFGDCW